MECERCGGTFFNRANLLKHLRKKICCDSTLSDVSRENLLRKLKSKKDTIKFHKCPDCDKRFADKNGLRKHCKKKHQASDIESEIDTGVDAASAPTTAVETVDMRQLLDELRKDMNR